MQQPTMGRFDMGVSVTQRAWGPAIIRAVLAQCYHIRGSPQTTLNGQSVPAVPVKTRLGELHNTYSMYIRTYCNVVGVGGSRLDPSSAPSFAC